MEEHKKHLFGKVQDILMTYFFQIWIFVNKHMLIVKTK